MIGEALEALTSLGWPALAWLTALAATGTPTALAAAAVLAWTWRRLPRRRTPQPAWARGRRAARDYARTHCHDTA
ncbi:hypothetical protein [Streptomyces griseosporeus]|uniref:hypothetical protein n=1 Tax=Streptomyces griseosporeus TaxID=1910 RepID=UPI0036FE80BD